MAAAERPRRATSSRSAARRHKTATDAVEPVITIRMYNVGFGDCFLVRLPTADGTRTMLIDCGQHIGGIANPMNSVLEDLIASVTTNGTAHIDVVVATHRHFDHISGFDSKKWRTVSVGEVWMPWTEKRGDPAADALRHAQHRLATALRARFASHDTRIGWLALNSFGNAGAEQTLLKGFVGVEERRYLPAKARADRTFTTPMLPGVTVNALGPSHDPDVIADMTPPKEQVFNAGAAEPAAATDDDVRRDPLFAPRMTLSPDAYAAAHPHLAEHADEKRVRTLAEEDLQGAAEGLEDAINGTSLMLILELGDHVLLFAGDAEWPTWSEALADPAWRELLAHTTVYKVSHHGSFNGSPTGFVDELLPDDAISLMSFRPVKKWPSIPRKSLVTALAAARRTLIRSDELPEPAPSLTRNGDLWVELALPLHR